MMTSSPDEVTPESPDVNTSTGNNVTVAATNTESLADQASPTIQFLVMVDFPLALAVFSLCGNGFTLITIRMTPRLWTKTNFILASMLVSHFLTGVSMLWYNSYILSLNVFNDPCRSDMVITGLALLIKVTSYVGALHIILISVDRYVAIVHPLRYQTTFTDHTLKCAISAVWITGTFMGTTFALWLINADPSKCAVIPVHYHLLDVLIYTLDCTSLFICYGRILAISRRHRRRIGPQPAAIANPVPRSSVQTTSIHRNKASNSNIAEVSIDKSVTSTGASLKPAVANYAASSSELTQEQQRQKIKSQLREHKAVYLTAAIVGTFVILSSPHMCGRVLESTGYNPVVTKYIRQVGGVMGTLNFASTWLVYAAVSKSYRHAYRQMLNRIGCCCCKNVTLPAEHSLVV